MEKIDYYFVDLRPADKANEYEEGDFICIPVDLSYDEIEKKNLEYMGDDYVGLGIYASYDENGLHEMVTGKPLMRWADSTYHDDYDKYVFYESIQKLTKGRQVDQMASDLRFLFENEKYKEEYINELNEKLEAFKKVALPEKPSQKSLDYLWELRRRTNNN